MEPRRSALIVATYAYEDEGLTRLQAPQRDAEALSAVLADPEIGDFDVRSVVNQPAHVVNVEVARFFADRRPGDLLLLHFSCHGVKDDSGELYFATTDTRLDVLEATAISSSFVNRVMGRSRSTRVVLLLDCCYAGAFARGLVSRGGPGLDLNERLGGRGRAVITASTALQFAFEGGDLTEGGDPREVSPSVFTRALVAGLRSGDADRDLDGRVSLDELYGYVYDEVTAASPHQTPGKWVFGLEGDLYVARRSSPVTVPAALPREIEESIESPLPWHRESVVQELERMLRGKHPGRSLAAAVALQRLAEDDSRQVSTRATAALEAVLPAQRASLEPSSGPALDMAPATVPAADGSDPGEPQADAPVTGRVIGGEPTTKILPPLADAAVAPAEPQRNLSEPEPEAEQGRDRQRRRRRGAVATAAAALLVVMAVVTWRVLTNGSSGSSAQLPADTVIVSVWNGTEPRLFSVDATTGELTKDVPSTEGRIPAISPDRRSIIYAVGPALTSHASKQFLLRRASVGSSHWTPLLDDVSRKTCPYTGRPSWKPDDPSTVALLCRDTEGNVTGVYVFDGRHLRAVTTEPRITNSDPTWLSDDSLVFARQSDHGGPAHLYRVGVDDGDAPRPLFTGGGTASDSDPASFHDRLLFVRVASIDDRDAGELMEWDGNGIPRKVDGIDGAVRFPAWSPDGRQLAFLTRSGTQETLWVGARGDLRRTVVHGQSVGPPAWGSR